MQTRCLQADPMRRVDGWPGLVFPGELSADAGRLWEVAMTDLNKALSLVPQIREAHEEAEKCQRSSHGRALEYAIKAGDALTLAKEAVGHGAFSIWRQQNLPHIPPRTATLYMQLAEHKDMFRAGGEISNTVADLSAKGE